MKDRSSILELIILLIVSPFLIIICLIIASAIWLTSSGPVLFWSKRIGVHGKCYMMPKFRTMTVGAPLTATHLLENPHLYVTKIGKYLRKYSLDELPQFWSVFVGDMSLVGPRPALPSQLDLIRLRQLAGVDILKPGITGWAQINGRDHLTINEKIQYEIFYLKKKSLKFDVFIMVLTLKKVLFPSGVAH